MVQLKVSLDLEGQRKDGGVGRWCKFVCIMRACASQVRSKVRGRQEMMQGRKKIN